jgi:hypothetical protein
MTPPPETDPWKTPGLRELAVDSDDTTIVRRRTAPAAPVASGRGAIVSGIVIIALLCAVCAGLAFQSGAYSPQNWLPFMVGVAALAVVVCFAGPAVPSGRFQKILLALFVAQAGWTLASIAWADSTANAWEETNRTVFYLIAVALVFAAVRWAGHRGLRALAVLVALVTMIVAVVIVVRLAVDGEPVDFFVDRRLNWPIGYYNALASFLMIGFWLALGLANAAGERPSRDASAVTRPVGAPVPARSAATGSSERECRPLGTTRFPRWSQPLLLAAGVFLLELALLPQSRGAFWTFFLALPFFVILSPNRFRALVDMIIVVIPVVVFWDRLNGPYRALAEEAPFGPALDGTLRAIGYSVAIVVGAWAVTWLVERWLAPLSRRAIKWVAIALIALFVAGAAGGLVYADARTDGLGGYLDDRWEEVIGDSSPGGEGSRFAAVGLNGRLRQWRVAAQAFVDTPLLGVGAQNFEIYWFEHREDTVDVRQPHSQPMQLLSELGILGLLLWLGFVVATMVYAGRLRFRPLGRASQAVMAAVMTAVISWFIHSSADWLWQMTATSLPALMLLAGLAGAGDRDAPAEVLGRPTRSLTRPLLAILAVVVVVSAALPYLSIRYAESAATADTLEQVDLRTGTAAALNPASVMPFNIRAGAHRSAAQRAPEGSEERLEQYQLEAEAWVEAIEREPRGWLYYYNAAKAFLSVRDAAAVLDPHLAQESTEWARIYLAEARRLNPLEQKIETLEQLF